MPASKNTLTMRAAGGAEVAAGLRADAELIAAAGQRIVTDEARALRDLIKRYANTGQHPPGQNHIPGTGPGPNRANGDYISSWRYRTTGVRAGVPSAEVWTEAAQANRLEYGFYGMTDSLGRTFHQPPYPHVQPAIDVSEPRLVARFDALIAAVAAGTPFGGEFG